MKNRIAVFVKCGLLLLCLCAVPVQGQSVKLETLLRKADLEYTRTSDGVVKIPLEIGDETLIVYMYLTTIYKGTRFEGECVYMYTRALSLPVNYRMSTSFLTSIAQMNDKIFFGSCSLSEDRESVLCNSSFWMKGATAQLLYQHVKLLYDMRREARAELLPYLSEE